MATAGQAASNQVEQNIMISNNTISSLKMAVAFNDGFNGAVGDADSQAFLYNILSIQKNLQTYNKLLESLSNSYSALGSLAEYDVVGNFNTSIGTLATDATNFGAAIGKPFTIPTDVEAGVKEGGGILLGQVQNTKVKDASTKIEAILKQVITVLKDPNTREKLVPDKEIIAGQIDQAAATLTIEGAYSYGPLLNSLGAPLGETSTSSSDSVVKSNAKLLSGLNNVALQEVQDQVASMSDSYDKGIAALEALIPLHESLQSGQPLDPSSVMSIVNQLQVIASAIQPGKGK